VFHWIEEVFKTDQTIEAIKDSGKFVTLDAKLMSSLTNVCEDSWTSSRRSRPSQGLRLEVVKHFS
jgi:hypothetical protein